MNQFVILKTNLARCMFLTSTPISSGLRSSPTVDRQSINTLMSLNFTVFFWDILHLYRFVVWFLVCHVCLRVTIMSSTQGKLTGYLPQALIWIGNVFVYRTCNKVRITYKYVIMKVMGYDVLRHFLQYFSYIVTINFIGGGNPSARSRWRTLSHSVVLSGVLCIED